MKPSAQPSDVSEKETPQGSLPKRSLKKKLLWPILGAILIALVVYRLPTLSLYYPRISTQQKLPATVTTSEYCSVSDPYKNKTELNVLGTRVVTSPAQQQKFGLLFGRRTFEDLVGMDGEVSTFSLSVDENKIAFIFTQDKTDTVFIYDFATNNLTNVYTLKETEVGDVGYTIKLTDVSFSRDGKLLAITSSTGLMIYDLEKKTVEEAFSTEIKEPGIGGVWGYSNPEFSGDGSKILLSKGYWEGVGYIIYDLKENKTLELPYGGYIYGSYVMGRYGDKLLVQETGDETESNVNFFIVDPNNLENKINLISINTDNFSVPTNFVGDDIYFITQERAPTGRHACNNIGQVNEVTAEYETLNKFNIQTGKTEKLLTLDATRFSGVIDPSYSIYSFDDYIVGDERLVVLRVQIGSGQWPVDLVITNTNPLTLNELGY